MSSLIISEERKAGPREERPFSTRVTEEIAHGVGDFGKEKHCEVKLVKLDKVHLLKATQEQGGDEGLISHGIEEVDEKDLEVETKRCDIKLTKLDIDKALLMSTKLPSVQIGGAIDQAKVANVVYVTGDQDTTSMKRKKSCVVRLAQLAMLGNNIKAQEEETDVEMTDV